MTYSIGGVWVVLNEVASIGPLNLAGANHSYLDIVLKSGQKVRAEIQADKEHVVGQSDLSSNGFVSKRAQLIKDFVSAWENANR